MRLGTFSDNPSSKKYALVLKRSDCKSDVEKKKWRSCIIWTLLQVEGVPIVFVSALEGKGRSAIMRKVFESYERWNARFSTARLNNWLQKVLSRHPRKGEGGYGAKMRYITQVKARPPTFVVFVTGAGEVEETDLRFVASALREDFNLGGIPIRVIPRHAKKDIKRADNRPSKGKTQLSPKFQRHILPSLKRNTMDEHKNKLEAEHCASN